MDEREKSHESRLNKRWAEHDLTRNEVQSGDVIYVDV